MVLVYFCFCHRLVLLAALTEWNSLMHLVFDARCCSAHRRCNIRKYSNARGLQITPSCISHLPHHQDPSLTTEEHKKWPSWRNRNSDGWPSTSKWGWTSRRQGLKWQSRQRRRSSTISKRHRLSKPHSSTPRQPPCSMPRSRNVRFLHWIPT